MVKEMDGSDFRAIRRVLEPGDFALSDGVPDPPPTDLIRKEAWDHVMTLPGDVAIRTTSYQGSKIDLLHDLSSEWIFSLPRRGITESAMLDVWDNLESSIFNTVHGHYKTALMSLRVALETSIIATRCVLARDRARWQRWKNGEEFHFRNQCDEIMQLSQVQRQENRAFTQAGIGIFLGTSRNHNDAWARSLYGRLCKYSHARGDTTDAAIWKSNGPIYSADGLKACYEMFLETYALMLILAKWSHPNLVIEKNGRLILRKKNLPLYMERQFQAVAASYRDWLWKPHAGRASIRP